MWIRDSMLCRNALRKRHITAQSNKSPSAEEVQQRMAEVQKDIIDGGSEIFSGDESGILFGARRR